MADDLGDADKRTPFPEGTVIEAGAVPAGRARQGRVAGLRPRARRRARHLDRRRPAGGRGRLGRGAGGRGHELGAAAGCHGGFPDRGYAHAGRSEPGPHRGLRAGRRDARGVPVARQLAQPVQRLHDHRLRPARKPAGAPGGLRPARTTRPHAARGRGPARRANTGAPGTASTRRAARRPAGSTCTGSSPGPTSPPRGGWSWSADGSGGRREPDSDGHPHHSLTRNSAGAAHWDGRNDRGERVSSGVYLYSLRAGAGHSRPQDGPRQVEDSQRARGFAETTARSQEPVEPVDHLLEGFHREEVAAGGTVHDEAVLGSRHRPA